MKSIFKMLLLVLPLTFACLAVAGEQMPPPYKGSAQFERLKSMAGTWKGTHQEGDKTKQMTVQFDVTANGSVVVEKMFPGTPMEMMTLYSENAQGKIEFTHYCTLGVHPRMELTQFDSKNFNFEFAKSNTIGKNKAHMHSLNIFFKDANHFTENWTFFQDGKKAKPARFEYSRVS